jgi:hypothetical protein
MIAPGHTRCGIRRRAGNAPFMQASLAARYGITLIPKQCSRNTTANEFAPMSACQRHATDYQCLAGATKSGAVAAGSLKDSAIILDGPVPLAS